MHRLDSAVHQITEGVCELSHRLSNSYKAIQTTGASYVYICMARAQKTCCQCRFPESESSSHFWSNLLVGKNMCTQDDRRWPAGLHGTPKRFGKLVEYNRFDASFFSVHGKQAQVSSSLLPQSVGTLKQQTWHAKRTCCRSQ